MYLLYLSIIPVNICPPTQDLVGIDETDSNHTIIKTVLSQARL